MIKPRELESDKGRDIWNTITFASTGNTPALQRLLERDPSLSRAQYWYTQPIHFAARAGHLDAVQVLVEAGADPEWNGYHDGSLIEMARDRGHESVAGLLEEACQRRGRVAPGDDHPIHRAAQTDDILRVRDLLDAEPSLVNLGDRAGTATLRAQSRSTSVNERSLCKHRLVWDADNPALVFCRPGESHGVDRSG